jgi:hypothetical protein
LDSACYDEAADHFATAVNSGAFSSKNIHETYEDLTVVRQDDIYIMFFIIECFVQLFGWDLQSLCLTAHQKRCQTFLSAGKLDEALGAHQYMMDTINETVKASCIDWSNGKFSLILPGLSCSPASLSEFKEQCGALAAHGILGVCTLFLIPFSTDLPAGGDLRARSGWL